MKLIALTGLAGSGKSEIVNLITDLARSPVQNMKFAYTLYEIQEYIYKKISPVYQRPNNFIKDRKLLQILGTEWGRNTISPNLWVDLWKAEVKYLNENYPFTIVVCDDLRFNNEAEVIKSMGGIIVKVERRGVVDTTGHISEKGIDYNYIDCVIENNGTLDDLTQSLLSLNVEYKLW